MEQSSSQPDASVLALTVPDTLHGVRLDHLLVRESSGATRSQISRAIKDGSVLVNDTVVKAGYRLKSGDVISAQLTDKPESQVLEPQAVAFGILYEDQYVLAVDKPPNLVVHPGSGNHDGTLINGLLHYCAELRDVGDESRPGIVHRLDKDTSGVLLVARTQATHSALVEAFQQRTIDKRYLALVHGVPQQDSGRVVAPIGRHPVNRQKMSVQQVGGKYAATTWNVKQRLEGLSLLEVRIETGRTHQIRVHLAHLGFPVAGDTVYGTNRDNRRFPRQMLHSWKIGFHHPETGRKMTLEAPLPQDFLTVLEDLEYASC